MRDIEALRYEYYGVLRIECFLNALSAPDGPSNGLLDNPKHNNISTCMRKTIADYEEELKVLQVPACNNLKIRWPTNQAQAEPHCTQAMNVTGDVNISGTLAYVNYWYRRIQYPQTCNSTCCNLLPNPYVP
jgi:hypothetical protein